MISTVLATFWLEQWKLDSNTKVYISLTTVRTLVDELSWGKPMTFVLKAGILIYNFFILPWALISITYGYIKQKVSK